MENSAVKISELLSTNLDFNIAYNGSSLEEEISKFTLTTFGIEYLGYNEEDNNKQIVLLDDQEINFVLKREDGISLFRSLLKEGVKVVIICGSEIANASFLKAIEGLKIVILTTKDSTLKVLSTLYPFLKERITEKKLIHANLLVINGVGVLIQGKSAIGKSEISLELIRKGHQLVSDDSTLTYTISDQLWGKSVEHQKYFLEIRGLGIINILRLYGIGAIADKTKVSLVIELVDMDEFNRYEKFIDPLMEKEVEGVKLPYVRIPVRAGRNAASLIEVAVSEFKNRLLGYSATEDFYSQHDKLAKGE